MYAPGRNGLEFVASSMIGALGGLLLGLVPTGWLMGLLGVVLLVSAIKTFQHAH